MHTVAVAGSAGGVGRTTLAISLAAMLSKLGRHVLLVDLDGGAGASQMFDIRAMPEGVTAVLAGKEEQHTAQLSPHDGTLWLMPLRSWSAVRVDRDTAEELLRQELHEGRLAFDVAVLDCGRDPLGEVGLRLATRALVPTTQTHHGLNGLFHWTDRWKNDESTRPLFPVAVLNDSDPGYISADKMRTALEHYDIAVTKVGIRFSKSLRENGPVTDDMPFVRRFPKDPITKAYEQLARELLHEWTPSVPLFETSMIGLRPLRRRHVA